MLQTLERPLNDDERRALGCQLDAPRSIVTAADTVRGLSIGIGVLALCICLFAVGLFRLEDSSGAWASVLAIAFVVGAGALIFAWEVGSSYFHWSRYARRFEREVAPKIRAALEDGRVSVCSVTSDSAIVIEEQWEDDSAYIFDLGDGRSLYLRGQGYRPKDEDAPWPARQFEIVRASPDGRWVGEFTGREPVSQVRRVPMEEMPECYKYSDEPTTETVLPGRPDEILRWLGHHAA